MGEKKGNAHGLRGIVTKKKEGLGDEVLEME